MPAANDVTLLRMLALDAGFDIGPAVEAEWLKFRAPGNIATIWLAEIEGEPLVAAAPERLIAEMSDLSTVQKWNGQLPNEAWAAWLARDRIAAGQLLRRIAILGRILPDQVLHKYNSIVEAAIEKTLAETPLERVVEVRQRVGQDLYRAALMDYWNGRCAITGVSLPFFLRASHAKPWRDATDRERLDVHNGLLLVAHLDIAFDKGFISVGDDGSVIVSPKLPNREREVLGVDHPLKVNGLRNEHAVYLSWHRDKIFIK
jgi:putative restriction endonuclease